MKVWLNFLHENCSAILGRTHVIFRTDYWPPTADDLYKRAYGPGKCLEHCNDGIPCIKPFAFPQVQFVDWNTDDTFTVLATWYRALPATDSAGVGKVSYQALGTIPIQIKGVSGGSKFDEGGEFPTETVKIYVPCQYELDPRDVLTIKERAYKLSHVHDLDERHIVNEIDATVFYDFVRPE